MIVLPCTGDLLDEVWKTLIALDRRQPRGWTLIGAQMVALHGLEHGRTPPRRSADIDILVHVRAIQDGTRRLSQAFQDEGFTLDVPNLEGMSHRFRSGPTVVDVLAPDGLGERTDLTTVPPARTIPVPGGT